MDSPLVEECGSWSKEQGDLVCEDLSRHGPLPPYFRPVFVDGRLKYSFGVRVLDQWRTFFVDYHPLSKACLNTYHDPSSVPESKTDVELEVPGTGRPPIQYIATDWLWERQKNGLRAVYEAIANDRRLHQKEIPTLKEFKRTRRHLIRERPLLATGCASKTYHPVDYEAFCINSEETLMAAVARCFGYSLAIAQQMGRQPINYLDVLDPDTWQTTAPPVYFRYPAASHQELFPPIYIGRYLGVWSSLVVRRPDTLRSTLGSDVSPAELNNLWAALRNDGLVVSFEGMLRALAYLWALFRRDKLDSSDDDLPTYLIRLSNKYLGGAPASKTRASSSSETFHKQPILSRSRLRRIAMFANNDIFRATAIKYEQFLQTEYLIKVREMGAQGGSNGDALRMVKKQSKELVKEIKAVQDLRQFRILPLTQPLRVTEPLLPPTQPQTSRVPNLSSEHNMRTSMGYQRRDDAVADEDGTIWRDDWRLDHSENLTSEGPQDEVQLRRSPDKDGIIWTHDWRPKDSSIHL
ncbi:hypothetical protein SLS55_000189 [Diplodia seriata]|uniref:Uncharacterized protein n=1 Tax=Diplodia seriata TaxID=420778 RepID=A0ABR3CTL6_9PEZI